MRFIRVVRFGGVVVFVAALAATILFAEGYLFDSDRRDIVRKGVVIFENPPPQATYFIDGKEASQRIAGELRMDPGLHVVRVLKEGFLPWQKTVDVPEDVIVRYKNLVLVPERLQMKPLSGGLPQTSARVIDDTLFFFSDQLHTIQSLQVSKRGRLTFTELPVPTPLQARVLLPTPQSNHFVGFDENHRLFLYDVDKGAVTLTKTLVRDMAGVGDDIFVVTSEGALQRLAEEAGTLVPFVQTPEPIEKIYDVKAEGSLITMIVGLEDTKNHQLIVLHEDGSLIYSNEADAADVQDSLVTYSYKKELFAYDTKSQQLTRRGRVSVPLTRMHAINGSSRLFVVTREKAALVCDDDGQNCTLLGHLDDSIVAANKEGALFIVKLRGVYQLIDLGPKTFVPDVLSNLVS